MQYQKIMHECQQQQVGPHLNRVFQVVMGSGQKSFDSVRVNFLLLRSGGGQPPLDLDNFPFGINLQIFNRIKHLRGSDGSRSKSFDTGPCKFFVAQVGSGSATYWFGKFPRKSQMFQLFYLRIKKISLGRVKYGPISYLLRVKSMSGRARVHLYYQVSFITIFNVQIRLQLIQEQRQRESVAASLLLAQNTGSDEKKVQQKTKKLGLPLKVNKFHATSNNNPDNT